MKRVLPAFALLILASFGGSGCDEQPGETISGVVNSDQPLTLPLSGKRVCVARVTLSRGADTSTGGTSFDGLKHRWAPATTLTVDGTPLEISGTAGNPTYSDFGDEWRWNMRSPDKKPPKELMGWGHDSTFTALASKSGWLGTRYVTAAEEYTACGARMSVRAIRNGNTLELVDTNKVDTTNSLRAALGVFAGFFCCAFLPMLLLIVFVVRRAMKKREATG